MDERDILLTLIAEALGEGPEGMRRVGETILNRAAIRGLTPAEVVRQPKQYTGYYAPGPAAIAAQRNPAAISAAEAAWELARQPGDPTNGADHYHANYVNPGWASAMPSTGDYGNHMFYKSREVPTDALARLLAPSGPRAAPTPAGALQRQFAFENAGMRPDLSVPSSLISDSLAKLPSGTGSGLSPTTQKSIAAMFSEPVRDVTPRMSRDGSVISPADVVFGKDMATAIFPSASRTQVSASDLARSKSGISTVATIPTRPRASASDMARGKTGISTVAVIPTTGVGAPPTTRKVQSIPMPATQPKVSASDMARGRTVGDLAAMFGSTPKPPAGTTSVARGASPSAQTAIASAFGPAGVPKGEERLLPGSAYAPALYGYLDPALARIPGQPRPASEAAIARQPKKTAPIPATRTITETITNPDWTASLKASKVPAGMPVSYLSRDSVALRAAGTAAAKAIPQFITRTRQVPVAPVALPAPRVAPVPATRQTQATPRIAASDPRGSSGPGLTSVVQSYRDRGMTAQQAYDAANESARERAIDRSSNPSAARSRASLAETFGFD